MSRALLCLVAAFTSGCVAVPYTPDGHITHHVGEVDDPESVLLSLGPRRFLKRLGEDLAEREVRVTIKAPLAFRDTVFPQGDWRLATLLADDSAQRLARAGADYLVLVGPMDLDEDEPYSRMLFLGSFWGYGAVDYHADVVAVVVDLGDRRVLDVMQVRSHGGLRALGLVYMAAVIPRTENGVEEALADELAITLAAAKPTGTISVVYMAAESAELPDDPLGLEPVLDRSESLQTPRRRGVFGMPKDF